MTAHRRHKHFKRRPRATLDGWGCSKWSDRTSGKSAALVSQSRRSPATTRRDKSWRVGGAV